MFGCIVAGPMSDALGRKTGQMLLIIPYSIGWAVMGVAHNNTIMLLGRFITGFCTGAVRPLGMVYIGELSDPKHRAVTLVCPSLAVYVGSLFSHTAGHYLPWRIGCYVFALPNIICFVMLLFLKESPLWLISKGKIEKGIESFKEFRGEGEAALKELKAVLDKQEEKEKSTLRELTNTLFSKAFLKSMLIISFLFLAVQFCGINTITFYAQDIFKSTFSGEVDAFMLMIVTDVVRVITTSAMCLFAKKVPRRTTFLFSCYGTVLVLLGLVLYLYIQPVGLLWVALTCLVVYLGIAGALTCISWSFVAEIFPSNVRGIGSGISSLISFALLFISVKVTPGIIASFGDAALYGFFAVLTLVSAVALSFLLPETNGKSLQDIENSLYNKSVNMQPGQPTDSTRL